MSRLPFRAVRLGSYSLCEISVQICNWKTELLSHLNSFHVFPRDNIRKTFIVMHNRVFDHLYTLSFDLPASFIL